MGRRKSEQGHLFYAFDLDAAVPGNHLVRRIAAVLDLSWLRKELAPHYSHTGRPSIRNSCSGCSSSAMSLPFARNGRSAARFSSTLPTVGSAVSVSKTRSPITPHSRAPVASRCVGRVRRRFRCVAVAQTGQATRTSPASQKSAPPESGNPADFCNKIGPQRRQRDGSYLITATGAPAD